MNFMLTLSIAGSVNDFKTPRVAGLIFNTSIRLAYEQNVNFRLILALAVIIAGNATSKINFTASNPGLKSATIELEQLKK